MSNSRKREHPFERLPVQSFSAEDPFVSESCTTQSIDSVGGRLLAGRSWMHMSKRQEVLKVIREEILRLRRLLGLAMLLLCAVVPAFGYEYHLQFSSQQAGSAIISGMTVIGDQFNADGTISGDAYYGRRACSGRYCTPYTTYYHYTAAWDTLGNLFGTPVLVSSQATPFQIPQPISIASASTPTGSPANSEQVYAVSGTSTTGHDSRGFGYVDIQASHFTWQTSSELNVNGYPGTNNSIYVIPYAPDSFQVTLASDGDLALNITSTVASITFNSYYDSGVGRVTVTNTGSAGDCLAEPVAPGTSCALSVTFDPTPIKCSTSPQGFAYNHMAVGLASDAGNLAEWLGQYTITGVPGCSE